MTEAAELFTELLYGGGSWLGILLILSFVIAISQKEKYAGLLILPVCVYLAINYLTYTTPLMWQALIMLVTSVFIVINLAKSD